MSFKDKRHSVKRKSGGEKNRSVRYLFFGSDKSLSLCVSKYLCCVSSELIKVKRRDVPLIWRVEEFGLILSYERWRGEF